MKGWDVNVGRCNLNKFTILLADIKSEILTSLICLLVLHTKKLISGAYQKSWTLDTWSGHLNSGCLDAWALNASTLDNWMLGLWMAGPWTLGPRKFYWFLVTSIPLLLLFTVEFLSISNALWLTCYSSIEIATNS